MFLDNKLWNTFNVLINTSACLNAQNHELKITSASQWITCDPKDPNLDIESIQLEYKTMFWWTCNWN